MFSMSRWTALLSDSSPMTWIASRIGMPARMKAPSWRERCMSSDRLTLALLISNSVQLRFSWTSRTSTSRSSSATRAAVRLSNFSTPFCTTPSRVSAT